MKKHAVYALSEKAFNQIYGPDQRCQIEAMVDVDAPLRTREVLRRDPSALQRAQIVFGGWGSPLFDAALLAHAPRLEAVFYGAGSIRGVVGDAFWERDLVITSSYAANGVPVAEYTEAMVVLALKQALRQMLRARTDCAWHREEAAMQGTYGSTVGLVSLGMIGRLVAERLRRHDLRVLAYDPLLSQAQADAAGLNVRMTSLEALFEQSDVVSLHVPKLPTTLGLITQTLMSSMKPHATLINTARGAVLDEPGLCRVLERRPDLFAVLDVTDPEPPAADSPLYRLPNVVLTPHVAGSMGAECRRMGQLAVDECRRFLEGRPLQWRIGREQAAIMA